MPIDFSEIFKANLSKRFQNVSENFLNIEEKNDLQPTIQTHILERIIKYIKNKDYNKVIHKISKNKLTSLSICPYIKIDNVEYHKITVLHAILIAFTSSNLDIPIFKVLSIIQEEIFNQYKMCYKEMFLTPLTVGNNKVDIITYILTTRKLYNTVSLDSDEIDLDISNIIDFLNDNNYDFNVNFGFLRLILKNDLFQSFKKLLNYNMIKPEMIESNTNIGKKISYELEISKPHKFCFMKPDIVFQDGKICDGDVVKMFCGIGYDIKNNSKIYEVDKSFPKTLIETILVAKKRYEANGMVFNNDIDDLIGKESEIYDTISLIQNMKSELRSLSRSHGIKQSEATIREIHKSIEKNTTKLEALTNNVLDYLGFPIIKFSNT